MNTPSIVILTALAATLSGCGDIEWFPEPQPVKENRTERTPVGGFIASHRPAGARTFTTVTAKGIFLTYTSLRVPVDTPVTLEKTFDGVTDLLLGQQLKSLSQATLVQTVVSLEP